MRSLILSAIFTLFIFSICYDKIIAVDSPCGDWEPYKEEKCFKIFDKEGLQTYTDAEKTCHQQESSSSLISIRSFEEQEFISNLLFKTHKVVDNIWIGAKYTNKFKWTDDSDLVFTYWAEGSPKNKTDRCIQLNSDENSVGKWSDVFCNKKNLVVCQKMQTWSLFQLQKVLLNTIKNPFPIGFIYVQLPNEKSPTEIWPWMTWNDVSSAYAGVFFRVDGGGSATFGQTQEENSPRLIRVRTLNPPPSYINDIQVYANGTETQAIPTGFAGSNPLYSLAFTVSGGEVRPRNMAFRVWKRAG